MDSANNTILNPTGRCAYGDSEGDLSRLTSDKVVVLAPAQRDKQDELTSIPKDEQHEALYKTVTLLERYLPVNLRKNVH